MTSGGGFWKGLNKGGKQSVPLPSPLPSILNYVESFISKGVETPVTYLYTYKNGYGFMVNYNPGNENIVSANVAVVINEELSNCTSKEKVINFFNDVLNYEGVSVSVVKGDVSEDE